MTVCVIVDGNQVVHQMWHMAKHKPDGPDVDDVAEWFLIRLSNIGVYFSQRCPDPILFCVFDQHETKLKRKEEFKEYKAHREYDEGIFDAIEHCKQAVARSADWTGLVSNPGYEADDLIASMALRQHGKNRVVIHSTDRDLLQCLVPERVTVLKKCRMIEDFNSHGVCIGSHMEGEFVTHADFENDYQFPLSRYLDYKCLVGDSSDNVPGAKWIGKVTATKLCKLDVELEELSHFQRKENGVTKRAEAEWPEFISRLPQLRKLFKLETSLKISGKEILHYE